MWGRSGSRCRELYAVWGKSRFGKISRKGRPPPPVCRLFAGFYFPPFPARSIFLIAALAAFANFSSSVLKSNLLQPLRINIIMSHALAKFGAFFLKISRITRRARLRSTAQPTFLLVTTPSLEKSFSGVARR